MNTRVKDIKIVVEAPGNSDCRCFHVNRRVLQAGLIKDFSQLAQLDKCSDMSSLEVGLAKGLLNILGVDEITLRKYEVSVFKGKAFEWDDLGPQIEAVIKNLLGQQDVIEKMLV